MQGCSSVCGRCCVLGGRGVVVSVTRQTKRVGEQGEKRELGREGGRGGPGCCCVPLRTNRESRGTRRRRERAGERRREGGRDREERTEKTWCQVARREAGREGGRKGGVGWGEEEQGQQESLILGGNTALFLSLAIPKRVPCVSAHVP
jgi:hypothetical protein